MATICVKCKRPIQPHEEKEQVDVGSTPGAPMKILWAHVKCPA